MKKYPGDIIILHKFYQKSWLYAMLFLRYGTWPMLFFILGYFLPFYHPNSSKNLNLKKMKKKTLEISPFYNSVPKIMVICYTVPEICYVTDVIIFHFEPFFTPLTARKIRIKKKWKKTWRYISFYHFTQLKKIMMICYTVPEIWRMTDVMLFFILCYFLPFYQNCNQMVYGSWDILRDGRTDRETDRQTVKQT